MASNALINANLFYVVAEKRTDLKPHFYQYRLDCNGVHNWETNPFNATQYETREDALRVARREFGQFACKVEVLITHE